MFGHGSPVTPAVCDSLFSWLRPGGVLFFNAVDFAGLPFHYRLRRRVRNLLYPALPAAIKGTLDERESRSPFFPVTAHQLSNILHETRIQHFTIESQPCLSPLWDGHHLECQAVKPLT
jgi:hypothetical protein